MALLGENHHGKGRVRVTKVRRVGLALSLVIDPKQLVQKER